MEDFIKRTIFWLKKSWGRWHRRNSKSSKIIELYTAEDGKSYFRDIILDMPLNLPLGLYSEKIPASSFQFRIFSPGTKFDWHVAPHKQYIVYLEGQVLVQASGGDSRIFKPGDILLANDLSGAGHITTTLTSGRSIVIAAS